MVAAELEVPEGAVRRPFRLRGGNFTLLVLPLADLKDQDFFRRLLDQVSQAPNFFHNAPVVLDLEGLSDGGPYNFAELGRRLRQLQLVPVGVQNGSDEQNKAAANAGMSVLPAGQATALRTGSPPPVPQGSQFGPGPSVAGQAGAQVITAPIRSGRQIYAYQRDLVALASVSPGAELLADGHIHVYGTLRGRALAGVTGNTAARIFCRKLEAELISISGYWQVRDNIDERLIGKPVQIFLDAGRLRIEPLA